MSSHIHWGTMAGEQSLYRIFHPVHTRFAQYWHQRHGGLGPVFADRPANHRIRPGRFAELVAYNHMDPVRQGLVMAPAESLWTSHRFYLRIERAPQWLDVEFGLCLCGFNDTEAGRKQFDEFVRSSERLHWQGPARELYAQEESVDLQVLVKGNPAWFDFSAVLHAAAAQAGCAVAEVLSDSRRLRPSHARRLIATYAIHRHGFGLTEIARHLGVRKQSVSYMLRVGVTEAAMRGLERALDTVL